MKSLYDAALEVSGTARTALLDESDPDVRSAVEALLRQEERTGGKALDRPAWELAESLLRGTVGPGVTVEELTRGEQLGPYRVQSKAGSGGMGPCIAPKIRD